MKNRTKRYGPSFGRQPAAFTLTEVMIALAMVALLLVGISRIFAITSATISSGQALGRAMRTQRAIQQTISADVLGVLPTSTNIRPYSGIMPANDAGESNAGMPFLTISNFRVATYLNSEAAAADTVPPPSVVLPYSANPSAQYIRRSAAIRGIDLNKDGIESATTVSAANGETVPIYFYGDRNFRCDTIGFFSRGLFHSQTGISGVTTGSGKTTFQGELESNEAFVWYGQLRVFDSDPAQG